VIAAYALAMFLAGCAGLYYLKKLFPALFDRRAQTKFETKALFGVSVPMSITQGAQYLNNFSAVLILGAFAAGAPVGVFNAAARTATFLTAVRFAFSGIFSPIISGLHARQDTEEMGRLYKDVSRWIFTGAFALFLVIVVFAPQVMAVFGAGFEEGVVALVIVAVAQLYSSSVGPAPRMLAMTGNQNYAMIATTAAAADRRDREPHPRPALRAPRGRPRDGDGDHHGEHGHDGRREVAPGVLALQPRLAEAAGRGRHSRRRDVRDHGPRNPPRRADPQRDGLRRLPGRAVPRPPLPLRPLDTDKEFLGAFWNVAKRYLPARFRGGGENRG
jgi:hypothetical membrane protein